MTCLLCTIDGLNVPADERAAAFFVIGMVHDDMPDPCPKHTKWMIVGAAVVAAARLGNADGIVKELRRIATHKPLRVVPSPSSGEAKR